jgi:hypothetical protein
VYSGPINNTARIVVRLREVGEVDMQENDKHAFIPEPYLHHSADVIAGINSTTRPYYLMLVGEWGMLMGTY